MMGMMTWGLCILILLGESSGIGDGTLVKRVVEDGLAERLTPLAPELAEAYEAGFTRDGAEYVCDNGVQASQQRGVMWSVELNQSQPGPVVASAWARAEQAEGAPNSDFSLYLDIEYTDGTPLWGQVAPFDPDPTAGWQRREVVLTLDRPIRHISYYLLYRNRAGRVRFKDARLGTFDAGDLLRFEGTLTEQVVAPRRGFLIRDVAQESGFVSIAREALGVRLTTHVQRAAGVTFYDVSLQELTGQDRAVTLVYSLPQPPGPLVWFHDPRQTNALDGCLVEVMNTTRRQVGANGQLSRYPFGAVAAGGKGCAVGIDTATPLYFRVGCQPWTRELFLSCDIGFAPEKQTADFRFCVFDFNSDDGFRGALARYYELYPDAFATRINEQGVWMPFAPISAVQGWQDFGFRFKEGDDETAWDDAHDILTFHYTEPMTWWMALEGEGPHTLENGLEEAQRLAAVGDPAGLAWESSAFKDEAGQVPGRVLDTPWCTGVVWSVNSAPGVPGTVTDFSNKWSAAYIEQQYGTGGTARCDGEYIDSAEAYVTDELNFRRDHFASAARPLCYALGSRRVGIYKGMIGFEYVRELAREMHERGRYTMANSTPSSWCWLAPMLDVMGTETNWKRDGEWRPMSDEELLYRRAMCKGKPFCFLMNTDFSAFSYEDSEKFMRRVLAYGMFPGFFSADASTGHYFTRPELYNRDRPLFQKYIPLCRLVAEAGWEPVTGARSDNASMTLERFGCQPGTCYLTIFNHSETRQQATVTLTTLAQPSTCRDLVRDTAVTWQDKQTAIELDAGDVCVLALEGLYMGDALPDDLEVAPVE